MIYREFISDFIMGLISSAEAAKILGVHITRVQVLIRAGRLPAHKIGRTYVVDEADLKLVEDRKPGRPRKAQNEKMEAKVSRTKSVRKR